jgi:hypothetical protein
MKSGGRTRSYGGLFFVTFQPFFVNVTASCGAVLLILNRLWHRRSSCMNCRREAKMPRDGEVNREFGVYRNSCCNAEILIPKGVTFPQCEKHVSTEWKDITDVDNIPGVREAACEKPRAK